MPQRDSIHQIVKQALTKDGWEITADPYVISYGERLLFIDLGITQSNAFDRVQGLFIGAERYSSRIAVEIKDFRSRSPIADLEQAIGQYVLYRLLLNKVDPEREIYLAVTVETYNDILSEPIGKVVISDLPLKLIIVDTTRAEVDRWIPPQRTERS